MKIKELREALETFQPLLGGAKMKSAAAGVRYILDITANADDETVSTFVAKTQKEATAKVKPAKIVAEPYLPLVQAYVSRLNQADLEAAEFAAVFANLQRDKAVRPVEAIAIAERYVGYKLGSKQKSKPKALDAIKTQHVENRRNASKFHHVEKLTVAAE